MLAGSAAQHKSSKAWPGLLGEPSSGGVCPCACSQLVARSPLAGEGGGACAADDRVHALQRIGQASRVPQVGDGGGQPRRIAKLLPHLVGAARERAHLVAAL